MGCSNKFATFVVGFSEGGEGERLQVDATIPCC